MDRFTFDPAWAVDYVPHCHVVGISPPAPRCPDVQVVVLHVHMIGEMEDAIDALRDVIQAAADEYDLAPVDEWTIGARLANCN